MRECRKSLWAQSLSVVTILMFTVVGLPLVLLADTPAKIKIGAVASLTGDAARNGLNWLEGAQVAEAELKSKGIDFELLVEDDGTNPSKAASAFVKLATVDKVQGMVGGTWDFLAETVYPLAKQYRVPLMTPTNPVEVLSASAKENPWIFPNGTSMASEKVVVREFLKSGKVKSLGLTYIDVPYGTMHAEILKDLAQELGIKVVTDSQVSYQGFADTIRLGALKVAEAKPDLVFLVLNYEGVDLFLRELERLHAEVPVLMTHALKEAFDFGNNVKRYSQSYGVFPAGNSAAFSKAFKAKFGREPYDFAAAGYDAVMFLYQALAAHVSLSDPAASFRYDGITGIHQLPPRGREVVQGKSVVMTTQSGVFEEWKP